MAKCFFLDASMCMSQYDMHVDLAYWHSAALIKNERGVMKTTFRTWHSPVELVLGSDIARGSAMNSQAAIAVSNSLLRGSALALAVLAHLGLAFVHSPCIHAGEGVRR